MKIKNVERIITSKNSKYISITICVEGDKSLGWEEVQGIKDKMMPGMDFIEIYPKQDEIINKANERHLIHIVDWQCPYMCDLEEESEIEVLTMVDEDAHSIASLIMLAATHTPPPVDVTPEEVYNHLITFKL